MTKFFKLSILTILTILGLSSCTDDYKYDSTGEWNAKDGYANVSFVKTSENVELDPTDATQHAITLHRTNKTGAVTVPITISQNDDNVFTLTNATFADGDSLCTFYVNFPSAEIGKTYTLKLVLDDPTVASFYSDKNAYTMNVTRVKWNDVGYYIDDKGNKVTGYAKYTDDFVTGFFGIDNLTFPTKLQERADKPGYFRMVNTYGANYGYNEAGDWDANNNYYIYIDATNPKKVYIPHSCNSGMTWSYGTFYMSSLSGYYLAKNKAADAEKYYGTYANGKITFPKGALLVAMSKYQSGGFYSANGKAAFKLVIDPSLDLYEATIKDDVDWSLLFKGLFTSSRLGTVENKSLYVGKINKNKDNCDVRFADTYGTPYLLHDPYVAGYDLVFCVTKDGVVKIPSEYTLQETGRDAMGDPIYAKINGGASKYTKNEITLNITFQNATGTLVYGTSNEVIANITYTTVGTGKYTYTVMYDNPDTEGPYTISKRDDKDNVYKISEWFNGVDFIFTWDKTTNAVTVPSQFTGYTHPSYGAVNVEDMSSYSEKYAEKKSYYDPATKTFHFLVVYYVSAGAFGGDDETFEVTWNTSGAKVSPKMSISEIKKLTPDRNDKRRSHFTPTVVNIKEAVNNNARVVIGSLFE
jgi:hypothetical protein